MPERTGAFRKRLRKFGLQLLLASVLVLALILIFLDYSFAAFILGYDCIIYPSQGFTPALYTLTADDALPLAVLYGAHLFALWAFWRIRNSLRALSGHQPSWPPGAILFRSSRAAGPISLP